MIIHTERPIGSWSRLNKEILLALLALCEGNPPVTGGFLSQRVSNAELWWFPGYYIGQAIKQTIYLAVAWVMFVMCDTIIYTVWRWSILTISFGLLYWHRSNRLVTIPYKVIECIKNVHIWRNVLYVHLLAQLTKVVIERHHHTIACDMCLTLSSVSNRREVGIRFTNLILTNPVSTSRRWIYGLCPQSLDTDIQHLFKSVRPLKFSFRIL